MTGRLFQYAFHNNDVNTVDDAKYQIDKVLTHYMPDDRFHTQCFLHQYTWCKTAFGDDINRINMSSALKSELPIGLGSLFRDWLFNNELDDTLIEILLHPGSTSLNEACKVCNKYANKKRYLGALSYEHAVARGILQWNKPYIHLIKELNIFGIKLSKQHITFYRLG